MSENGCTRVMIVAHHPAVRRALAFALSVYDHILVVAQAGTGSEAIPLCAAYHPDVLLVDGSSPESELSTLGDALSRHGPHVRLVVLSILLETGSAPRGLANQVSGYLQEQAGIDDLARAICAAGRGYP